MKILLVLICLVSGLSPLIAQDLSNDAEMPAVPAQYTPPQRDESPDESAIVRASAGLGYYRLNLSPMIRRISAFKEFNQLSYDVDPIVARQFEVTSTLFFLQGGINYITNNFREKIGFSKKQDRETDEHKSTMMRRLDMFAGIHVAGLTVKSDFSIRNFKGTMTSNGIEDGIGVYRPVIYYDYDGSRINLSRGSKLEWNMTYQQYTIKVITGGSRSVLSGEMGGQYVRYKAPAIFSIDPDESYNQFTPIIINSVIEQYNLCNGAHTRKFFTDNLYYDLFIFSTLGKSRVKNPWFEVKGTLESMSYSFGADTSLRYVSDYARFEFGGYCQFVMISTTSIGMKLNRDITIQDKSGSEQTFQKGTKADISSLRDELFYGAYVKASLYF